MAKVKDPVCGMAIDADVAVARSKFDGTTYYFCSEKCRDEFVTDPARYSASNERARSSPAARPARYTRKEKERHEPRFTKSGFVAPKFGSAGSGGAEYELLPESHDVDDDDD